MLAIVIKNGKAVVVTGGQVVTGVPTHQIATDMFPDLIRIGLIIAIIYVTIKLFLPYFSRYLGYLVSQFKKGVKENEQK